MSKSTLLHAMVEQLQRYGVYAQHTPKADLFASAKFVAKQFLGKKIVLYEASLFANEVTRTVHYWEKTSEDSRGISFGMQVESYTHNRGSVHRKVQMTTIGPDGKPQSMTIDLASISKAVESTVRSLGWDYRAEVLRKNAEYPT